MHALIIEDESMIAMAIENVLRECGFASFDLAASPLAAIAAASHQCPDLITSDVQLKPGCGIDTVLSICSGKNIPVIFITGNADDVILRLPDSHVLPKPFSDKSLAASVALALLV